MKTAEEIRNKVATTLFNLEIIGFADDSPLDGAHYALESLFEWINKE